MLVSMQTRSQASREHAWVLYLHQRPRQYEALEYLHERGRILEAIEHGPMPRRLSLDAAEMDSHVDLQRSLFRRRYHTVIVGGQGPDLGLLGGATAQTRLRCAPVLAEIFAVTCRPGAAILLLGCCTTWLAPALAARGLRGVSFDGHLSASALLGFLGGYIDGMCAGRGFRDAFEDGCRSMAVMHLNALEQARSFGPDAPPDGRYVWVHPPAHLPRESDL